MLAPDEGSQARRDDESMRASARRSNAACGPSDKPGLAPNLHRALGSTDSGVRFGGGATGPVESVRVCSGSLGAADQPDGLRGGRRFAGGGGCAGKIPHDRTPANVSR